MCLSGSKTSVANGLDAISFFRGSGESSTDILYFSSQLNVDGRPKAAFCDCTENKKEFKIKL